MKKKFILTLKIALCLLLSTSAYAANNATFMYNWNDTGSATKTLNLTGNQGSQVYNFTTTQTFKLETGTTANAGEIVLTYPRYILEDRLGTGYAQAQLTLPDAPEKVPTDGSFYYYFSGNDLIITNTKMVTASTTLSFEILYSGSASSLPVSYSKNFTAKCSVNGELKTSSPLTLNIIKEFDSGNTYTNVTKTSYGKQDIWQAAWGTKPTLPSGTDADYVYIEFYISLTNTTGLLPQYVHYTETLENNGVIVTWGKYTTTSTVTYYQNDFNTNASYSPADINTSRRVVVRYKISDLSVSGGNYSGYNNIAARYKLEAGDEQNRSYKYNFYYQELAFNYTGDAFAISKGNSGSSLVLPKELLNNQNSRQLPFYLQISSRGYALTESGNAAYTISTIDDLLYLDGTRLTTSDYFIEEMSFAFGRSVPNMSGSEIAGYSQTSVNTTTGAESEDTNWTNYPLVDVYTRNNDANAWVKFGSYKITGNNSGTFTPVSTGVAESINSSSRIALLANVTQIKYEVASKAYKTTMHPTVFVRLKPSATVKALIMSNPLATVENIGTLIIRDKNNIHRNPATESTIYGSNKQAIIDHDEAMYGDIAQHGRANVSFFPRVPTIANPYKSGPYTATADDPNQRYIADYSMAYVNSTLMAATSTEFRESTAEQKDGIFYDLLPMGMTVDINSIKAWCYDPTIGSGYNSDSYLTNANAIPVTVQSINFVENWRNSGRTMMKIHVTTTADNIKSDQYGNLSSGFMMRYRAYYPYTAVKDYGTSARNSMMFFSNSGEVANIHWGEPGTYPPNWGISDEQHAFNDAPAYQGWNMYDIPKAEIDAGWWTDVNDDGNPAGNLWNTTLPIYEVRNVSFPTKPMASESGLIKKVKPSSSTMYSYNGIIWPNDTYNYQLRYSNAGTETTGNIIFYDKIESVTGAGSAFKGTLTGINTSHPAFKGIDPVVYYSTNASIDLTSSSHRDLSNGTLWSTTAPANLATVTAVAVNCTEKTDGTAYTLPAGEAIVIEINMKAPDNFVAMSGKKAYNTGVITGTSTLFGSFIDVTDPATELTPGIPIMVDFSGMLTLNGASTMDANQFQFRLTEDAGNNTANYSGIIFTSGQSPIVLANGSGAFDLGTLSFSDAGTYTFTATEIASRVDGNNDGYIFDNKPVTITVVILKVENELTVTVTTTKDGADAEGLIKFANLKIKAIDDAATTKPGISVDIPVLNNDELLTGTVTVVIHGSPDELAGNQLKEPAQGTVSVKPDGKITYTPKNDTWEGVDEFEYEIYYSDKNIRSRAKVYVLVITNDYVTCDDTKTIHLNMPAGAAYIWYNASSGGAELANNTDLIVNRDDVNHYVDQWVAIDYKPNGKGTSVYSDRIKVSVKFIPTLMYWKKNAANTDWNNPANWTDKNGVGFDTGMELIPFPCTTVHIPTGANIYPSLENGSTNRDVYNGREDNEPTCDIIYLHFGGEVVRTDLLHYNNAHVELALAADRWNMLSAPLRYVFPGDYYQTDPCPHADELRIYQQLFAMKNPQTGEADTSPTGDWTKPFNDPDVAMPAGFGYAISLQDKSDYPSESHWTPLPKGERHSIWLPKDDESYNIYYIASCNIYDTRPLERNKPLNYRFIYEGGDGFGTPSWTGNITLTTAGTSDEGKQVIVGNPFMSHWNFNDFYLQNSEKIKEEYKVLEGDNDAAFVTYSPLLPSWTSDKLIAPMQSVLVTSLNSFNETGLKTRVTSMAQNPGVILKSAVNNEQPDLLKVIVSKDGQQNHSHILFDESASNNYLLNEDSYKLFVTGVTEPVSVYTRSSDNYALDINVFGDCSQVIPIGVRTSQTGTINLQFEGIENFLPGTGVFLVDAQNGMEINLRETSGYSFEKKTSNLFLDGRFYLSFKKGPNSDLFPQSAISIFTTGNQLQVISNNADIDEVQVFDMQGRLLHEATNLNSSVYTRELEDGMHVVKVLTGKGVTIKKVTTTN